MATRHQLQAALQAAVSAVETGIVVPGSGPYSGALTVDVGIAWPPLNRLQDMVRTRGKAIVSVYDTKTGRNSTRWLPVPYDLVLTPATLTVALSMPSVIANGGTATLTLGATVTPGDAVALVAVNSGVIGFDASGNPLPYQPAADVAVGIAGDTPTTMATKLVAAITADSQMSAWITASATGPVVTVTAKSGVGPLTLSARTGNGGTQQLEVGRRNQRFQIACWTSSELARQAVTDPIEAMLALAELNFGLLLPDNSYARLFNEFDHYLEDGTLQDAYRRDFFVSLDYPITVTDQLYAILAPELNQVVELVGG